MSRKITPKTNEKWHFIIGRGIHPVIVMDLVRRGHTKFFGQILNLPFNIYFMKRYEGATYFLEAEYQKVLRYFRKKLKKNLKEFYRFPRFFQKKHSQLIAFLRKIKPAELKNLSDKKIKETLEKFFSEYSQINIHFYLPFFFEDVAIQELRKIILPKLKKIKKANKSEEYILILTQDPKFIDAIKEKIDLLKITLKILKNKKLKRVFQKEKSSDIEKNISKYPLCKKILSHQRKYFGINTYLFNVKEYTLKDVIQNIKNYLKDNSKKTRKDYIPNPKKLKNNQKKILKELKLSKNELAILKLTQDYVHFRNIRITRMGPFQCLIKPILEEQARRMGLNYQQIVYLTVDEILSRKFNKKELAEIINGYVYLLENGRQHLITGKAKEKFLKKEKKEVVGEETKAVKGLSVFPGKVCGKVKKGTAYTFHQLKKGDILVCSMTVVEATPYLNRCKAIVTDEGGITCHAAIVSRELKIPCVVGTKIATKVLKDGDLVEVDAEKGVVKILKQ